MTKMLDITLASGLKDHADELKQTYGTRNTQYKEYKNMYLMDWEDKPQDDNLKLTIDPTPRNMIVGAKRLLCAAAPEFKVSEVKGQTLDNASDIEQACKRMWEQAGRLSLMPVQHPLVESGLLFGEMHVCITSTKDLLERAKKAKKGIARAERIAALTPFLYEAWDPMYGYPEYDVMGLAAYYREVDVKVNTIEAKFGELALEQTSGKKSTDLVTLGIYYDEDNYAVWVDNNPIIAMEHGLPFIPIRTAIAEGSMLWDKPEHQSQPMLYGLEKSGIWQRKNLVMTVLYTNVEHIGINPTFVHTLSKNSTESDFSFDNHNSVITLQEGETLTPMVRKGIIDESFNAALEIAENKTSESTMYPQALGQAMASSTAFSTVNLLSQAGRLPLTIVKDMVGSLISDVMECSLLWYKQQGGTYDGYNIKPKDIPDNIQIDATLEVALPQDKLQMANIAKLITEGNQPLTSQEWARENILSIGQSDKMDEAVWAEKTAAALMANYVQQQLQLAMQQMQGQMQPPEQMMPEQIPPGGMPQEQQMPPEMMGAGAMPGGGMEGMGVNPALGGMPPQMGGMLPGQGEAVVPPEEGMM